MERWEEEIAKRLKGLMKRYGIGFYDSDRLRTIAALLDYIRRRDLGPEDL